MPHESRWFRLQSNARQTIIGRLIDEAMIAIEKVDPSIKGVLPKDYDRPALNAVKLRELVDLNSGIALGQGKDKASDLLGGVYASGCGLGGMLVTSDRVVEAHGGRLGDIAIYGRESNYTTSRPCTMNLAVHRASSRTPTSPALPRPPSLGGWVRAMPTFRASAERRALRSSGPTATS